MAGTNGGGLRPIGDVARDLDIAPEFLEPYGRDQAKVHLDAMTASGRPSGKLILVSAITPTPAGEGKTTTSIGLAQGMWRIGRRAALALRQPSPSGGFGRSGASCKGSACSISRRPRNRR